MIFSEFTIFDVFIKNDFLYIILSINNKEIHENELTININSDKLNFVSKAVRNGPSEPILVFIYNKPKYINQDKVVVDITFNNITQSMNIENVKLYKKHFLALTTLFKDDYGLFPLFYEYYKKQGVDHFYMYYNGIITPEIRNVFAPFINNVTLIEWNFPYWLFKCKYIHHAQMGQMHHALYKYGKNNCKYMIFCDLDEYMNIEKTTLKEYILNNPNINTFGFCNFWSKTLDNTIPKTFPNEFMVGTKFPYAHRSKNIYNTDTKNTVGIHSSMCLCDNKWTPGENSITDLNLFHFYNWSNHRRIEQTHQLYKIIYL